MLSLHGRITNVLARYAGYSRDEVLLAGFGDARCLLLGRLRARLVLQV